MAAKEISMIIRAVAAVAVLSSAAFAQPMPVPRPVGPGVSFCVPSQGERHVPMGWTPSGSFCLRSGSSR